MAPLCQRFVLVIEMFQEKTNLLSYFVASGFYTKHHVANDAFKRLKANRSYVRKYSIKTLWDRTCNLIIVKRNEPLNRTAMSLISYHKCYYLTQGHLKLGIDLWDIQPRAFHPVLYCF